MSETTALVASQQFDDEQIALIKRQIAPAGTTNDELQMFLAYAQRTCLDPFSRQIYLSERRANVNGQWVVSRKPEVTIDGFRLVAERTGKYAGQIGPEWCGTDGVWRDVWLEDKAPSAARIGVLRHDFTQPVYSVALYREYSQTNKEGQPNSMWKKYPSVMLAKCAESLALRRAFPRELSGLYTREEMPDEREDGKQAAANVAEQRIHQLTKAVPPPEMECPSDPLPSVEAMERRAAKPVTARAQKEPAAPLGFDMLGHFADIKKILREECGSDVLYYSVLEQFGYKKSNQIPDIDSARAVYKAMNAAHKALKTANENRTEIAEIRATIGDEKFWTFAGAEGIDGDALESLAGDALQTFTNGLRESAK